MTKHWITRKNSLNVPSGNGKDKDNKFGNSSFYYATAPSAA